MSLSAFKSVVSAALFASISIGLTGCAISSDLVVNSTGRSAAALTEIQLQTAEEDGSMRRTFAEALEAELLKQNVTFQENAPVIAEYSIAVRQADTAIADGSTASGEEIAWLSKGRKRRNLDRCDALRVRGALMLVDRASGAVIYKGSADVDTCAASDALVGSLATALVRDASG